MVPISPPHTSVAQVNYDPTKPMLQWDTAWRALRDGANLHGLRFHELRHTVVTELAGMGVAEHVLGSVSGHLSRRMLEHYSHIRIDAKRRRSTRWMPLGATQRQTEMVTATAAKAMKKRQTRAESTPSWRSPTTSRHSHVTVCG